MDSFFVENDFPLSGIMYPAPGIHANETVLSRGLDYPLTKFSNRITKRFLDILLAIILIPTILSWLIPLFAIFIKLDSRGPVFFRQKRNGQGGKLFTCIKFRTMFVNDDADHLAARINDERVTRFGKFLRHHHLDELPQLFNVLLGDMSVIGPRPYMVKENLYYESLLKEYSHRHSIKPGITGLAQSFGYFGSQHDLQKVKERVDLDIIYIQKWTLRMDIKIIYRTFVMLFGFKFFDEPVKQVSLNKTFKICMIILLITNN